LLTASELVLYLLELICNEVIVILTDKIDQTVNFVYVGIKEVEPVLKIRLQEDHLVAESVVRLLEALQVCHSLFCSSSFFRQVKFELLNFCLLQSDFTIEVTLNFTMSKTFFLHLFSYQSNF